MSKGIEQLADQIMGRCGAIINNQVQEWFRRRQDGADKTTGIRPAQQSDAPAHAFAHGRQHTLCTPLRLYARGKQRQGQ